MSEEFNSSNPGDFFTTRRKRIKQKERFKKLNRADSYSGFILGQYSPLESNEDSKPNVKPSSSSSSVTTAAVKASAVLDTSSIKEQTIVQSLPISNYSLSSSSADNIFEKVKIASPNKDSVFKAISDLESIEGNTAMKKDIVCKLLKAEDDIKTEAVSKNDVTNDNEISDKLNRLESLILYLLTFSSRH